MCGFKNGHQKYVCSKRDCTMSSRFVNHSRFNNEHNRGGMYGHFIKTRILTLNMDKFSYELHKLWGKWLWAWIRFAHCPTLITPTIVDSSLWWSEHCKLNSSLAIARLLTLCGSYVLALLNWTCVFEWHMTRFSILNMMCYHKKTTKLDDVLKI